MITNKPMINIAILASGSGTNAENIIKYFKNNQNIQINLIISNNKDAKVISKAKAHNVPVEIINNNYWKDQKKVLPVFDKYNIDIIVLAGFLILVPKWLIDRFEKKIINIHPALLPKFGGKGMYGKKVHEAVINKGRKTSGITIHYVNEKYDKGSIIFQASCLVPEDKSPESLAKRVHNLEYEYYPIVIDCFIMGKIK